MKTLSISLFLALCPLAWTHGQKTAGDGPEGEMNLAVALMQRGDWQGAKTRFEKVIADWSSDSVYATYPPFGHVHYNKGFCEMKLKQYDEAIDSFKSCHEKYPNKLNPELMKAARPEKGGTNIYWKLSVFQWAAALQFKEKYDEAIEIYNKFIALKPDPTEDQYNPGILATNMASCYAKRAKVTEAETQIAKAFDLADRGMVPQQNLWQAFLDVLEAHILQKEDKTNKALEFVQKFCPRLGPDPLVAGYYSGRLLTLARDGIEGGRSALGLRLYSLVPKTSEIIAAGEQADPKRMGPASRSVFTTWKSKMESGEPIELNAFFGIAKAYEGHGDDRASFAVYDYMARQFLKAKQRPNILYAAARMASNIGEMTSVEEHGLVFLKEFPTHELRPAVSALLLSSLFYNGEYEDCLRIASDVRAKMTVGSHERDLPDFVYGASLYYLGRHNEAQPELDSHAKNYLQSTYRENSTYYQASNLVKLFEWVRASELLDVWLKAYEPKKSPLLDVAYLDRASCYFALASPENKGNEKALEYCEKIISNYPKSVVLDRTYNLRGDVLQNQRKLPESEESYLKALAIGEQEEHEVSAATSLMQLVTVTTQQEKFEDAIKHYDAFFKKYPHTYSAPYVAVGGLIAFEKTGKRQAEAKKRVQDLIVAMGENKDTTGVEQTISSYVNFLLKQQEPQQVIAELDSFPNIHTNRTLQAWLLITKIGIVEERLAKDATMQAKAKVYYEELETRFDKKELGDYILYRLGAKIAQTNPLKATAWFEPLTKSNDPDLRVRAELEIGKINANSTDKSLQALAVKDLARIRSNNAQNPQVAGPCTLALARLYHASEQWPEANKEWIAYMTNKAYAEARPEAQFRLGESYEKVGKQNEAIKAYTQMIVLFANQLDYSAEAALRIARILDSQGKKVEAYKFANVIHYRMRENKHPKVEELDSLRQQYMAELKSKKLWKEEYAKDLQATNP